MKESYVYILSSKKHGTLYIGVTNDLIRRVYEHKYTIFSSFTHKYQINKLVYYESFGDITHAIAKEKQLKKWNRQWKINLIEEDNPDWIDLYDGLL
jgi:putative endonuclease